MRSYIRRGGEGRKKKKKGSPCPTNRCPTRAERRSICHGNGESQWKSQREKSGAQFFRGLAAQPVSTWPAPRWVPPSSRTPLSFSPYHRIPILHLPKKNEQEQEEKKSSFFKKRRKRFFFYFSVQKRKGRLWLPISSFSSLTSLL